MVDRRSALRLAGSGAVGVLTLAALAGCAEGDTVHEPDPLAAQEALARADAAAATAAIAVEPARHSALSTVAAERTAHADALRAETVRVIGVYADGTTPTHLTSESDPTTVPPSDAGARSIESLRTQLMASGQSAAELARTLSGYRAGLLASIGAACAAQVEVLLP
ncbi:hypothetical protein [Nocardia sp. CNY236]|uniref:hypothetical protein n=1 Tax=Nocardia sp. CNY236 TaxID=1169152 RepID=UPI000405E9A1|nr:hypothetical protein [Nocardia sp. CNY236]